MLIILSPSKTLDFKSKIDFQEYSNNDFLEEAAKVIAELRKLSVEDLQQKMAISKDLAQVNYTRFREWSLPFSLTDSRQAIFAFMGDAYNGLNIKSFSKNEINFLQSRLRILSAMYGTIKPLDLIKPYRIEMAMKLPVGKSKNLYEFWTGKITMALNQIAKENKEEILVNLASSEYFKAIDTTKLKVRVVNCVFKEYKGDELKIVSMQAKRARGMMTAFIAKNRIENPEELKLFDMEGYFYSDKLSTINNFVFTR